jgi:hypothetical protein
VVLRITFSRLRCLGICGLSCLANFGQSSCWAGVYRGGKVAELPPLTAAASRCLFLHAVTSAAANPTIHPSETP